MHIPVDLGAPVQLRVDGWEEVGGEEGGEHGLHELVEGEGGDEFVDVEGEGGEGEGWRMCVSGSAGGAWSAGDE